MTVALMEAGIEPSSLHAIFTDTDAGIVLDTAYVTMTRINSTGERPYVSTRVEVEKMLRNATAPMRSQKERVLQSVRAMSKYRKAR